MNAKMMMTVTMMMYGCLLALLMLTTSSFTTVEAFAPQTRLAFGTAQHKQQQNQQRRQHVAAAVGTPVIGSSSCTTKLSMSLFAVADPEQIISNSVWVSAATIDPTTALNDAFSTMVGTPVILAVPILVGLGVVAIIVWILTAAGNPVEEEDD